MNSYFKISLLLLILAFQYSCNSQNEGSKKGSEPDLSTETAKFSYAIGIDVATQLKRINDDAELDLDVLFRGIEDYLNNKEPLVSQEEAAEVKKTVFTRLQSAQAEKRTAASGQNLKDEEAFLEKNKARQGVTTTESGLQYEILREGTGGSPSATDRVSVNYKGSLLDGTEFDSSYKRGQPSTFNVNQVIKGWSEGLQLMKAGGKYKLYVPSKLGYAERGAGDKIGPNAMLIFEVELMSIEK